MSKNAIVVRKIDKVEWIGSEEAGGQGFEVGPGGGKQVRIVSNVAWDAELQVFFKSLCSVFVDVFLQRYAGFKEDDDLVFDHPLAQRIAPKTTGTRSRTNRTAKDITAVRILEHRVLYASVYNPKEDNEVRPQEWFHVEDVNGEMRWARLRDIANVDVLGCFFVKELLQTLLSLHHMVGLASVKNAINAMLEDVLASSLRPRANRPRFIPLLAFIGNAGTGKTEMAKLMGSLYWLLGDLRYGHTCRWIGPEITGSYLGQTPQKTLWAWRQAYGGVLFLDEAYALAQGDSQYGKEALNTLVGVADPMRTETGLIVAGYPYEMEKYFYKQNSGLMSRLTKHMFADYTVPELCEIWKRKVHSEGFAFENDEQVMEVFRTDLEAQVQFWPRSFGNARAINRLFDLMRVALNTRVCHVLKEKGRDVASQIASRLSVDDVHCAMREFGSTISLSEEDAEQLQRFARDFSVCESPADFVRKEKKRNCGLRSSGICPECHEHNVWRASRGSMSLWVRCGMHIVVSASFASVLALPLDVEVYSTCRPITALAARWKPLHPKLL